jgi:hypothetical protein
VTRLGEYSPIGRLFSLGSFSKISTEAQIFGLLFLHRKSCLFLLQKTAWATIWTIFSQTHLTPCQLPPYIHPDFKKFLNIFLLKKNHFCVTDCTGKKTTSCPGGVV